MTRGRHEVVWLFCVGLGFAWACRSEREQKVCTQALFDGRVLTKQGDLPAARDKLQTALGRCDERRRPYVEQLRQEIAHKERALEEERRKQEEERARRRELPVEAFMKFVEARRDAADKAEDDVECYPRTDPQFGWCETTKRIGDDVMFRTRYWRTDPDVYRFSVTVGKPIVCDDLGPHRVVRSWRSDGVERTHCEFSSKALRGLGVLVSVEHGMSRVEVFSSGFVAKDDAFRRVLEEGW